MSQHHSSPRWMRIVLYLAGVYNLAWGAFMILFPLELFRWLDMEVPNYPSFWQCIGMLVGVYGIAYALAARDPFRHWVIVLVGLLGKVLGPIGLLIAAGRGELPWRFGWINVTNDVIWWGPFALILWQVYVQTKQPPEGPAAG